MMFFNSYFLFETEILYSCHCTLVHVSILDSSSDISRIKGHKGIGLVLKLLRIRTLKILRIIFLKLQKFFEFFALFDIMIYDKISFKCI